MSATVDYGKLKSALSTIRDECKRHGTSCCGCIFRVEDKCGITGESVYTGEWRRKPQYWNIPDIQLMRPPKEV